MRQAEPNSTPNTPGRPLSHEALARLDAVHVEHEHLRRALQESRRQFTEFHQGMKARVEACQAEMARGQELCKVLLAGRLKRICTSGWDTAEELGRRQELALVANHMSDALLLFAVDLGGGRTSYYAQFLNPAAERLLGRPAAELVGRPFGEALAGPTAAEWAERLDQTARSCAATDFEGNGEVPDRVLETRLEPILGPKGKCTHILCLSRDITERKRAERQLQEAWAAAEEARAAAERANQAKDNFLAVLSHELRTPLAPVLATASILQEKPQLDDELRDGLEMIRRNAELEARLIDDLLDMTRITRGKVELRKEPVLLGDVIRRAVDVCRPDIGARGLEFGMDMGNAASSVVEADAARLQQVFWNLLKNSVKFTPPGGCVGVRCYQRDGHAFAEVNDSGAGIDPEALPRIFNAFEQAERSITRQFGGLGLGLTISKALVEMHGGTIEADSPGKGKGATFRVKLPVASSQLPVGESRSPLRRTGNRRLETCSLRVLLVEDHGDTARVMTRVLTRQGYQVQAAGDVDTALGLIGRQGFDLLISDLGLPGRSGIELIRELRTQGHTLPAIALSGFGQEEDMNNSREAGFQAHLTKPVSFEQLYRVIDALAGAK